MSAADDADANHNELCAAVSRCISGCGSLRKVVSHIFGRNKTCTMQIPEACTISWCRQHYQRFRYRSKENWINIQIDIVRCQLDRIEEWGGARSWTIGWGKGEKAAIEAESAAAVAHMANDVSQHANTAGFTAINQTRIANTIEADEDQAVTRSAGFLSSYIGTGKTLDQVRAAVDAVEKWAETPSGHGKSFPQIEFLPDIDRKIYPPASGRKEPKRRKPLTPPAEGSSSSPTVVPALTSPVKNSAESLRRNPTRRVKRSLSTAFGDDATVDDATTEANPSAKRPQPQASRPAATPKVAIGREGTASGPVRKKGKRS
ncbi:hypothetical protein MMC22_006845 [Lobaria immixta]|nr:hypothetical protein [Lobaria immixta]